MITIASQITSLTIVYSTVYSGADQRKHQSSVSLAFVRGIHRGPVNSLHKRPVTRKMLPYDDVIMFSRVYFKFYRMMVQCVRKVNFKSNETKTSKPTVFIKTPQNENSLILGLITKTRTLSFLLMNNIWAGRAAIQSKFVNSSRHSDAYMHQ